jgi:predicted Zn-dependent protease with MMP-like domain
MSRRFDRPPGLDDIAGLVDAALRTIPEPWRGHLRSVPVRVEDFCDEETEREMGLESPFDLLGLYRGVPLDHKSLADPSPEIDLIFLYRRPILDYWCETGEDLTHIVRHVLIHEVGHHFGLSDEDIDRIEAED